MMASLIFIARQSTLVKIYSYKIETHSRKVYHFVYMNLMNFAQFKSCFQFNTIHRFALLYIWRCIVFFHHVPSKMAGGFARKGALATLKWLFSGVLALVNSQIPT